MRGYESYLKGLDGRVQELSILEVGNRKSPIDHSLERRNYGVLRYRFFNYAASLPDRASVMDEIARHSGDESFGFLWDAGRLPYPLDPASFDEIHLHMLDTPILSAEGMKINTRQKTIAFHSIDEFARELARLAKAEGRLYLTTQVGFFFEGMELMENPDAYLKRFPSRISKLSRCLQGGGFTIDVLHWGEEYLGTHRKTLEDEMLQPEPIRLGDIGTFTDFGKCAANLMIATKR